MYDMIAAKKIPAKSAYKLKYLGEIAEYITIFTVGQYISEVVMPVLHFSTNLHLPF